MLRHIISVFILTYSFEAATALWLGSPCVVHGRSGQCVALQDCVTARDDFFQNGTTPTICSHGKSILICCENESAPTTIRSSDIDNECGPVISLPAPEIGRKAWEKCLEYQERLLHPCHDALLGKEKFRFNKCQRDTLELASPTDVAYKGEFPHMVILGYDRPGNFTSWYCEGVIISERFVITLASCADSLVFGDVNYVRPRFQTFDSTEPYIIYQVKTITTHPSYDRRELHDIALLETDTDIVLDEFVVPACLDVGNLPSYESAVALNWDKIFGGGVVLNKTLLSKALHSRCTPDNHHYNETIQFCYEDKTGKGHRFGSHCILQEEPIKCMYVILGLKDRYVFTTKDTGIPYNRIPAYISWIESIVWPDVKTSDV